MHKRRSESGAVSLFLVIFAMLLITVVTLSFLRVMIKDQSASSVSDLSQSAYDSAMAGTEDAKRELIYYRTVCSSASANAAACSIASANIASNVCNQSVSDVVKTETGGNPTGNEVAVQQSTSTNDTQLNQAYTCVKTQLNTDDYVASVDANASKIIPLTATGNISSVTLQWYSQSDIGTASKTLSLEPNVAQNPLYVPGPKWPINHPSLMRAQLIQFGAGFKLSDFDTSTAANSNANTLFLYPTQSGGLNSLSFADDVRKTPSAPRPVNCVASLSAGGYACSVTIALPAPLPAGSSSRTAYLRLTPFYNATHLSVTLQGDPGVQFKAVQPSIDSTGRANDQYRRVESRVDLVSTTFPFPEAAVDVTGNLCKNFVVTDNVVDYRNNCNPSTP